MSGHARTVRESWFHVLDFSGGAYSAPSFISGISHRRLMSGRSASGRQDWYRCHFVGVESPDADNLPALAN